MQPLYPLPEIGGFGWRVLNSHDGTLIDSHNDHETFPLASTAKLFIGEAIIHAIQNHELA